MPVVGLLSIIVLYFFREQLKQAYTVSRTCLLADSTKFTFLTFCNEQLLSLIQNNNEPIVLYGLSSKTILDLGLSFILVVFLRHWQGRVTGILVSSLILGLFAFNVFF